MRLRGRTSILGLGLLGLGVAACGGSSSSSSTTTTTTTVASTSTSIAATGGTPAGCQQALQPTQSLGPRIQSAAASGNLTALRADLQRAATQFQTAANQPGTAPAVKSALNNLASATQSLSQAIANGASGQQAQQAAKSFANAAGQLVVACT